MAKIPAVMREKDTYRELCQFDVCLVHGDEVENAILYEFFFRT